jgi:hypothetical protein
MKTTVLQLLPTTTQGTPSGTYDGSSLDFSGVRQQAADYYGGFGGLQTVAFYLNQFEGDIEIEATLETDPGDDHWFRVYRFESASAQITENFSANIRGNFVWLRARVRNFSAGTITKITVSY